MMRRAGVWAGVAVAVLAAVGVTAGAAGASAERRPVVLVHGWLGAPADFNAMKSALQAAGFPVYTIKLPGQENVANAQAMGRTVTTVSAEHGNAQVDLVTHSMGGLSARHYLKFLGGSAKVRTYVSMGTS